jgi:hypothetical protein
MADDTGAGAGAAAAAAAGAVPATAPAPAPTFSWVGAGAPEADGTVTFGAFEFCNVLCVCSPTVVFLGGAGPRIAVATIGLLIPNHTHGSFN